MCEYMWDPEVVMRRLLFLGRRYQSSESEYIFHTLRQRQAYCTDNECLNDAALPGPGAPDASSSDFFLMCIVFAVIVFIIAFRPRSLRGGSGDNDTKRRDNDAGPSGNPPTPPPTAD